MRHAHTALKPHQKTQKTHSIFSHLRFKRGLLLCATLSLFAGATGCEAPGDGAYAGSTGLEGGAESAEKILYLSPEVHLIGLGDIFEGLDLQLLSFDAEIYLLPLRGGQPADSAIVRYTLNAGQAHTEKLTGDLAAFGPGQYQVLVRINSSDEQSPSVQVQAELSAQEDRAKGRLPSQSEPAPIPALPLPGDQQEPAPIPAKPSPADNPAEPAPIPARSSPADCPMEPAPIPAEPAPIPAREEASAPSTRKKADGEQEATQQLSVRSMDTYEFFAGNVEIFSDDQTLEVTWDVRHWLRAMLAQTLDLKSPEGSRPALGVPQPEGFQKRSEDFRIKTR